VTELAFADSQAAALNCTAFAACSGMLGDAHRCVAIWPFLHKLRAAVTIAFVGQISDWKHTRHATCNTPATATARDLSFNRNLNAQ
jgi:hypothetical protein